jgi:signal peptidase I
MNKSKIFSELKAIIWIILSVLLIKVTVLEAYIVPTGSMENTIMTGDFLIGSRFVYGMRTPDWLGIPYTDVGFSIPYYKFPTFKRITVGDVLIFKYPRDKYVKYVKRCVAGPGDTIKIDNKDLFVNNKKIPMWENGKFIISQAIPRSYSQNDIYLKSEININKDNMGPIYIPKKDDIISINSETDWRYLLPIMLSEGNKATLKDKDVTLEFTLQDQYEIGRRKENDKILKNYYPKGKLITPWSRSLVKKHFDFLFINDISVKNINEYKIKQNYYWAMGDNRDDSLDSRYWGFVPENFILGEALFSYFSINLKSWIPRWDRIGKIIR